METKNLQPDLDLFEEIDVSDNENHGTDIWDGGSQTNVQTNEQPMIFEDPYSMLSNHKILGLVKLFL